MIKIFQQINQQIHLKFNEVFLKYHQTLILGMQKTVWEYLMVMQKKRDFNLNS
jgi:hypothetical protein